MSFPRNFNLDTCTGMIEEIWDLVFDIFLGKTRIMSLNPDQQVDYELTETLVNYFVKYTVTFYEFINSNYKTTWQKRLTFDARNSSKRKNSIAPIEHDKIQILSSKPFDNNFRICSI